MSTNTKIAKAYDKVVENGNAYSISKYLSNAIRITESAVIATSFPTVTEAISFEPSENEKGGIITFSTDVNAVKQHVNKLVDWLKKKLKTIANRLNYVKKVDDNANAHNLVGWTIGKFLNGRYTSNGKLFSENSLSVEIVGVNSETLMQIAEELCSSFEQESALVKDYSTVRIAFVAPSAEAK